MSDRRTLVAVAVALMARSRGRAAPASTRRAAAAVPYDVVSKDPAALVRDGSPSAPGMIDSSESKPADARSSEVIGRVGAGDTRLAAPQHL